MRSLVIVVPASLVFVAGLQAQALTEHAAAAAGASIGTAGGKGISNSMTKIFGDVDKQTGKAADSKKQTKTVADPSAQKDSAKRASGAGPAPIEPTPFPSGRRPAHRAQHPLAPQPVQPEKTVAVRAVVNPAPAAVPAPPPEPVVKVPTREELTAVKVGATESDMIAALGQPSSRVTIPDDDGHLRESCQYWANGHVLGTIHLDNGQVASVVPSPEN